MKASRMTRFSVPAMIGILASAMVVGAYVAEKNGVSLPPAAHAQSTPDAPVCSNRTLRGSYAYSIDGNIRGFPAVSLGHFDFNGGNTLSGFSRTITNGRLSSEGDVFGRVNIDADCSGEIILDSSGGVILYVQVIDENEFKFMPYDSQTFMITGTGVAKRSK